MGIANLAAVDQRLRGRETQPNRSRGHQRLWARHSGTKQIGLEVMHRLQPRPRLARRMGLDHDAPPIGQPDAGYHTDV